jgi:LysM repeat protein
VTTAAEGIVEDATTCSGKVQRLKWFDVFFVDDDGFPVPNVDFEVIYANGEKKNCQADANGYFKDDKAVEGLVKIRMTDGSIIESYGNFKDFSNDDADPSKTQDAKIEYIIRKGDTLSKIAKRFGVAGGWRALYRATGPDGKPNSKRLKSGNPNLIYPGEILWVPTKRRVVRINTKNAATAVTKVRIRGKKRSDEQKKTAQTQDIYYDRFDRNTVDNLLIVAGWDDSQNNLNINKLCDTLRPIVKFVHPNAGSNWNLYVIQRNIMCYHDSSGKFQHRFVLNAIPKGLAGAYTVFEIDGVAVTTAIYDRSCGLADPTKPSEVGIDDLIDDKEEKKKYLDSIVDIDTVTQTVNFKKVPIYYLAPSTKGSWQTIVLEGGNGCLDNYIGDNEYNAKAHDRNLAVLDTYNSFYMGILKKYINDLKAIPPSNGEDAVRELGPPPNPYQFPLPEGASRGQRQELVEKMMKCSSYSAWLALSDKVIEIQNERWPSTTTQHKEGSVFFRVKFTLEPSVVSMINDKADSELPKVLPLYGRLSSYKTVKLEWNLDAGTDKIKTGESRSVVFKEEGVLKASKFAIEAGKEVEIDDSGGRKVTVKGKFLGYGVEASSDGEHKLTGPGIGVVGTSAFTNQKTAEGGMGLNVSIPGVGSVYVGIHFVGIKAETLLVYLTGAPGFFERRSCDALVKTAWTNLTYPEMRGLEILGWNQEIWDIKDQLEYNKLPNSARKSIDALSPAEGIAALHLGFRGRWADNWVEFWKKLPPIEGVLAFAPIEIRPRR